MPLGLAAALGVLKRVHSRANGDAEAASDGVSLEQSRPFTAPTHMPADSRTEDRSIHKPGSHLTTSSPILANSHIQMLGTPALDQKLRTDSFRLDTLGHHRHPITQRRPGLPDHRWLPA